MKLTSCAAGIINFIVITQFGNVRKFGIGLETEYDVNHTLMSQSHPQIWIVDRILESLRKEIVMANKRSEDDKRPR